MHRVFDGGRLGVLRGDSSRPRFEATTDGLPRFVGTEGMGSIALSMARGLDVRQDVWISPNGGVRAERNGQWTVFETKKQTRTFDAIVIAHNGKCAERLTSRQPARDVHALLRTNFSPYLDPKSAPGSGKMTLTSVCSMVFEVPVGVMPSSYDAAFIECEPTNRILRFIGNNAAKYGRTDDPTHVWTALSSAVFGKTHKHPQVAE